MRASSVLIIVAVPLAFALTVACGGDDASEQATTPEPTVDNPISSGFVTPDTFLSFEGQRYRLQDTLQADLVEDEFVELGVASEADIDYEGDLAVFSRTGDASSVYTFSPILDEAGEDTGAPGLWLRWLLAQEQ